MLISSFCRESPKRGPPIVPLDNGFTRQFLVYHAITDLKTEFSRSFPSNYARKDFLTTRTRHAITNLKTPFHGQNDLIFNKSRCTKDSLITDSRTENMPNNASRTNMGGPPKRFLSSVHSSLLHRPIPYRTVCTFAYPILISLPIQ